MKKFMLLAVVGMMTAAMPAAAQWQQITNGPITGTCVGTPALGADTADNIINFCGANRTWSNGEYVLQALPTQTAVTTLTTIQPIGTFTALQAGIQNVVGRTLRVCGAGVASVGSGTPTLTISLTEGGVTPVGMVTGALAVANNQPFNFCTTVGTASAGATGTLESHGWLTMGSGSLNNIGTGATVAITNSLATTTLLTMTTTLAPPVGSFVVIQGLTNGAAVNGVTVQVASSSSSQFTANYPSGGFTTGADSGTAAILQSTAKGPAYVDTNTAASSAIDLTAANTLKINATASSTVTTITLRWATLELLN